MPEPDDDEAKPRWLRLLAPLQSEDAAFRMLVWVVVVFAVLIGAVLLVRALT